MIEILTLNKSLGRKLVLSNVSLSLKGGDIVGLTGPVGAGKSSLLHVMTGLMDPDSGTVTVLGQPSRALPPETRQKMNYASSSQRLSGYASVMENLRTFGLLYGIPNIRMRINGLTSVLSLPKEILNKKVYRLSSGENSLANLCKSLLNDPDILLLDEITAHMDPVMADRVRRYLVKRNTKNKLTVMVTQNLSEIFATCTRVVILNRGRILCDRNARVLTAQKIKRFYD